MCLRDTRGAGVYNVVACRRNGVKLADGVQRAPPRAVRVVPAARRIWFSAGLVDGLFESVVVSTTWPRLHFLLNTQCTYAGRRPLLFISFKFWLPRVGKVASQGSGCISFVFAPEDVDIDLRRFCSKCLPRPAESLSSKNVAFWRRSGEQWRFEAPHDGST